MNNFAKFTLEQMDKFWQTGKVSVIEVISYLLPKVDEQQQKLVELQQAYHILNLTVYQLKADVDSLKARQS